MFKQFQSFIGVTAIATAIGLPLIVYAQTQIQVQESPLILTQENTTTKQLIAFNPPNEGTNSGRGITRGSVFGRGQTVDVNLNFNRGRFSLSLAVPPGTGAQVNYNGTYNRLRPSDSRNPNSFILEGRVQSFASSANNLKVMNTKGSCQIEVFDARVISSSCDTQVRNSSTSFQGLEQF
jgi:hypothetical protein